MAKKILIIDDEPELVKAITIRLKANRYEVLSAPDAEEGISKAIEIKPDLILLDIIMPKIDGYEACKRLKTNPKTKDIPVIILTASGHRDMEKGCIKVGADGMIKKPFETTQLLELVNKFLKDIYRKGKMANKILIVDDEPELLKGMKIRLSSWGYDVISATNGKEAIELIKKDNPDVVILDIMMPQMDGIETLRRIREFNKKLPVLMLTAYGNDAKFEKAIDLGISGFIHKGTEFENASELVCIALKGIRGRDN